MGPDAEAREDRGPGGSLRDLLRRPGELRPLGRCGSPSGGSGRSRRSRLGAAFEDHPLRRLRSQSGSGEARQRPSRDRRRSLRADAASRGRRERAGPARRSDRRPDRTALGGAPAPQRSRAGGWGCVGRALPSRRGSRPARRRESERRLRAGRAVRGARGCKGGVAGGRPEAGWRSAVGERQVLPTLATACPSGTVP